jgi:hypothetical protein
MRGLSAAEGGCHSVINSLYTKTVTNRIMRLNQLISRMAGD